MGQTANMSNSNDNAAYEPQEQNASMDASSDPDGMGNMDPGMEEMDMGDGGGMDAGMGGAAGVNTKDLFKKRKLFNDYKELLSTIDNMMEISANIIPKDLSEDAKKIFRFVSHKMEENREKLIIILSEQYFNLSYQQLLTIYMYIKMATKLCADMLKQINDLYGDKE